MYKINKLWFFEVGLLAKSPYFVPFLLTFRKPTILQIEIKIGKFQTRSISAHLPSKLATPPAIFSIIVAYVQVRLPPRTWSRIDLHFALRVDIDSRRMHSSRVFADVVDGSRCWVHFYTAQLWHVSRGPRDTEFSMWAIVQEYLSEAHSQAFQFQCHNVNSS